jgi:hypothetical protein
MHECSNLEWPILPASFFEKEEKGVGGIIFITISCNSFLFLNLGRELIMSFGAATQQKIEWKPKSSQKSAVSSPGVIGTPGKSLSPPAENLKDLESEADKLSRVNVSEHQNVIIAQHIRVPETDRCRLTFGSIGTEFDSSRNLVSGLQPVGTTEESNGEPAARLVFSKLFASWDGEKLWTSKI